MNILCVCTSGKDRSPVMAEYCREKGHKSWAVGINGYFCEKAGTTHITVDLARHADRILVVSSLHQAYVTGMFAGHNEAVSDMHRIHCPTIIVVPGLVGESEEDPEGDPEGDWFWVRSCMEKVRL